jgi:hypothetical protein
MAWPPKGKWSPLCLITETLPGKRWKDLCPNEPGVFRLIGIETTATGYFPQQLARVCGIDPTGTLYIGATTLLRGRLGTLVRTHNPSGLSVGGGHTHMNAKLKKRFPMQRLALTWRCVESTDMVRNLESQLFRRYEQQFGELPPMNAQG